MYQLIYCRHYLVALMPRVRARAGSLCSIADIRLKTERQIYEERAVSGYAHDKLPYPIFLCYPSQNKFQRRRCWRKTKHYVMFIYYKLLLFVN